jgi:hypothetical protein
MNRRMRAALVAVAFLLLAGCGAAGGRAIRAPQPAPGDTAGQIMSVTGTGFTICGVSDDGPAHFDVVVCGDLTKARAALQDSGLAQDCTLHAYQPGDGGRHDARALVVQWWVSRATGPGWSVTSTRIVGDSVDVEVKGDLSAAGAVLNSEFPNWLHLKAQSGPDRVNL